MKLLAAGALLAAALAMLFDTSRVARFGSSKGVGVSAERTPVEDSGRATNAAPSGAGPAQVWQRLFNGQDLSGWKHLGGGRVFVRDGLLVLRNDPQRRTGYLVSERKASDFEAHIRCRVIQGDSGFCFHCRPHPRTPIEIVGLQVQLNVEPDRGLGGLFEMHGRGWLAKPSENLSPRPGRRDWIDCRVRAGGPRIQVWLNGEPTVDLEDTGGAAEGFFALQIHGGGHCQVEFEELAVTAIGGRPSAVGGSVLSSSGR